MYRAPARCAPFTWTSACCSRSSITRGSGSEASRMPSARKPRSTAAIATLKGTLSRNASSGMTRISVGERPLQTSLRFGQRFLEMAQLLPEAETDMVRKPEMITWHEQHAVLGAQLLDQIERADRLAVLHEADRSRLGRLPREGVAEALEPSLEHGIVRPQDATRALEHALTDVGPERHGREMIAGPRRPDRRIVVARPYLGREARRSHHPADSQTRQTVRLRQSVHD